MELSGNLIDENEMVAMLYFMAGSAVIDVFESCDPVDTSWWHQVPSCEETRHLPVG